MYCSTPPVGGDMMSPRAYVRCMAEFGTGIYTLKESGRLLGVPSSTLRHWLFGYRYDHHGPVMTQEPLWPAQYGTDQEEPVLGFRDLLEARIVRGFREAGLGMPTIRACLKLAREVVGHSHPFSSARFRTDGATLFIEQDGGLLDLRTRQRAFRKVIEPSFKDLDYNVEAASRWWLLPNKRTVLLDPQRSFGQPIIGESGIRTASLAQAYAAEKSVGRVARLYEIKPSLVRDALAFEGQGRKIAA